MPGYQPGCVQQGAVTADGDDEVGALADLPFRHTHYLRRLFRNGGVLAHEHVHLPGLQVGNEGVCGLGDARVREFADQCARPNGKGHVTPQKTPPNCEAGLCSMAFRPSQTRLLDGRRGRR